MYFFDLETGKWFSETINVSTYDGGYNNLTNTFWSYNQNTSNPTINSFKIEGFKNEIESTREDFA